MRTLCSTELAALKRYGVLEKVDISKQEYLELKAEAPHYVGAYSSTKFYKYVVPTYVTEETVEQYERAMSIDILQSIQNDIGFFKTLAIILLIFAIMGVLYGFTHIS